jgi:V/A-type H+-transporting ATPase subunit A
MQYAFDPHDTYTGPRKQYRMLQAVFAFFAEAEHAINRGISIQHLRSLPLIESFARMGSVSTEEEEALFERIIRDIEGVRTLKEER